MIGPLEVQKPETGQKTGFQICINRHINTNSPLVLEFFQYDHQQYKKWKPDRKLERKPDPGTSGFYGQMNQYAKRTLPTCIFFRYESHAETGQKTGSRTNRKILWKNYFSNSQSNESIYQI